MDTRSMFHFFEKARNGGHTKATNTSIQVYVIQDWPEENCAVRAAPASTPLYGVVGYFTPPKQNGDTQKTKALVMLFAAQLARAIGWECQLSVPPIHDPLNPQKTLIGGRLASFMMPLGSVNPETGYTYDFVQPGWKFSHGIHGPLTQGPAEIYAKISPDQSRYLWTSRYVKAN